MAEEIAQAKTDSEQAAAGTAQSSEKPWSPRVSSECEFNTNPFERFDHSRAPPAEGASINRTVTIRDATEDTAPLQGSKDVSDDDYLGGG
jgi:hypothetical protein